MQSFLAELNRQRWDDHRFYHHCRINQSLHLFSACSFVIAYLLLPFEPAWSAIIAWCLSMTSRQAGHFFFEPRGFDEINQVTDEYKEAVKVGYNIQRKIVLMAIWALCPVLLFTSPSLFGFIEPATTISEAFHDIGIAWLSLGLGGMVFRIAQLSVQQSPLVGFTWGAKILTDPFHDIALYYRAPLALLRGERYETRQGSHQR